MFPSRRSIAQQLSLPVVVMLFLVPLFPEATASAAHRLPSPRSVLADSSITPATPTATTAPGAPNSIIPPTVIALRGTSARSSRTLRPAQTAPRPQQPRIATKAFTFRRKTENASDSAVPKAVAASPGNLADLGFNLHAMWTPKAQWQRSLPLLKEAGAGWIRVDAYWANLEPTPNIYDRQYLDAMIHVARVAKRYHLRVLFVVLGTPKWDQVGPSFTGKYGESATNGENSPPAKPSDYGAALRVAAQALAPYNVAFELWNEPNNPGFLSTANPETYAQMACSAYVAVKSVSPSATVIAGALSGEDVAWLKASLADGLRGCFDAISEHPYVSPPNSSAPWVPPVEVTLLHNLLVSEGLSTIPIWITEIGWPISKRTSAPPGHTSSANAVASYLKSYLQELRRFPYVTHVFIYDAVGEQNSGYGVLTSHLQPRPAYTAIRDIYDMARGSLLARRRQSQRPGEAS